MQCLDSDWTANILAGLNFQAQENGLMLPDGVCAISLGLAGMRPLNGPSQRTCFRYMN